MRELKDPEDDRHGGDAERRGDRSSFKPIERRKGTTDDVTRGQQHQEEKPGEVSSQSSDGDSGDHERRHAPAEKKDAAGRDETPVGSPDAVRRTLPPLGSFVAAVTDAAFIAAAFASCACPSMRSR